VHSTEIEIILDTGDVTKSERILSTPLVEYTEVSLKDGSIYKGHMVNNQPHGRGKRTWMDGKTYDGDWQNGKMHGKGSLTFNDGRKYEGDYDQDMRHGYGSYSWPDGRKFTGRWVDGKQHGKGRISDSSGTSDGVWEHGSRVHVNTLLQSRGAAHCSTKFKL